MQASPGDWTPTGGDHGQPAPNRPFDTAAAMAKTGLRNPERTQEPTAPARVRADTEVPAPMLRRVGSTGLDTLLCAGLILVPFWQVYQLDTSWWPSVILLLGVVATVLITVLRARSGRSLFSGLFGIRTVSGEPGHPPGIRPMVRRHLVSAGAFLAAGASIWSAFRDPTGKRLTWQDNAAGTRVIDTRWGVDPMAKVRASTSDARSDAGTDADSESEADAAPDRAGAYDGVVVPPGFSRPARPGVLASGLDMAPGLDASHGGSAPLMYSGAAAVAVTDAAERASGVAAEDAPPVVVVEAEPERIAVRLVDDTGQAIALARSALVGRDPAAGPDEDVEHLLAIDDPDRTVSKTHLRIDVVDHGVTVVDRGSSNGTVVRIGGAEHPLEPGVPLGVPVGTTLVLGDRTLTVEAP